MKRRKKVIKKEREKRSIKNEEKTKKIDLIPVDLLKNTDEDKNFLREAAREARKKPFISASEKTRIGYIYDGNKTTVYIVHLFTTKEGKEKRIGWTKKSLSTLPFEEFNQEGIKAIITEVDGILYEASVPE